MAITLEKISGGVFAGNPIIVRATPHLDENIYNFLRVKIKVSAHLSSSTTPCPFEFSAPAENGQPVDFDISSALRAVADTFVYGRELTQYPYIGYSVTAWEEYMKNGEHFKGEPLPLENGPFSAFMGGFSDKERWLTGAETLNVARFTTKPTSGEIVAQDETLVYPSEVTSSGPTTVAYSFSGKSDFQTVAGKHKVYVVPSSPDRYHFYFLNHLGVIETIAATSLAEESKEIKSETHMISRMETFSSFSRMMNRKTSSAKIFKMSSGPLNAEWLDWWADEFLITEQAWVRIDGHYYPCAILPSESTLIRKNASPELMEVIFSVRIQGL